MPKSVTEKLARKAFSIDEFCDAFGISRAFLYALWSDGGGPKYMQVRGPNGQRGRRLITVVSANEWSLANEVAPAKDAA